MIEVVEALSNQVVVVEIGKLVIDTLKFELSDQEFRLVIEPHEPFHHLVLVSVVVSEVKDVEVVGHMVLCFVPLLQLVFERGQGHVDARRALFRVVLQDVGTLLVIPLRELLQHHLGCFWLEMAVNIEHQGV
jgi:hypothetical protein